MRNIAFALGGQMLNILMSFAMRTVFVNTLGEVYLGVNGLFTNILMVFSLADLGVGTAISTPCTSRWPSMTRARSRR